LQVGSVVGLTIPSFWLGIMMILALTIFAPGLQVLGYVPFSEDPLGNLARLVLPAFALALPILANLARLVRSAMLDALQQDYIRTARAKGVPERTILFRHALRNALIPFVTSAGIMTGYLLGGAIVVEQVFAIPGLGRLILGAIAERNYPLVQATILVITFTFVLVNFVVDLLYAAIDPRVRL
jgi:peptide/nickel transport system permease protein